MDNKQLRVLVVDDNPDIHRDFIKILKISNHANQLNDLDKELFGESPAQEENMLPDFDIVTASQGEEGVEQVENALRQGYPFALAFVDIRMPPGIDGLETIKRIWNIDPNIQIVICTAYSDYTWEYTVKTLGMSDNLLVLKKPFDVLAVRQLASALTQKWLAAKDTQKHTASLNHLVNERTESLHQSLALLRATIESSSDGILVVNLEGSIIDYNQQFVQFWSIPADILALKDENILLNHMISQTTDPAKFLNLHAHPEKLEATNIQNLSLKNGKVMECYSKPHRVGKSIAGRVWSFHDITEQIRLREKLEFQATHDALTQLPNRSLLQDRLSQAISNAIRHQAKLAVFFLDLDRFKLINDNLSHEMGDRLLQEIANRLQNTIRKEDTVSRLGGDEFVLIFPQIELHQQVITIAKKLLSLFNKPFLLDSHTIKMTASIGISLFPEDATSINTLLSNADLAMYHAKSQGRNQYSFYSKEINKRNEYQFKVEAELQRAIEENEFFLTYQPQFDLEDHHITSIEALLRWNHPTKGVIFPKEFISVAENSGQIIPIGEWVIRQACRQIIEWHKSGLPLVRVAVNVATKQLKQRDFPAKVKQILSSIPLDPSFLEIEVTENIILDNEVRHTLIKLKNIGCKIILDDFGTGNSSLNLLKKMHIDRLKIDQSFVKNITRSRGDEAIVEAIIAISHSMNFKVIAEGIENQSQIEFLQKKRCDVIQGFLWSKPLEPKHLKALLAQQRQIPKSND